MNTAAKLCFAFLCVLVLSSPAFADAVADLNIPGIGNQIPVESFSFGTQQTLTVTRFIDPFSPLIFQATVTGTHFATGSLDFLNTSISFDMTDIVFISVSISGAPDSVPQEQDTLSYATGTVVTNTPEPSSLLLLGGGLLALVCGRRRQTLSQ